MAGKERKREGMKDERRVAEEGRKGNEMKR